MTVEQRLERLERQNRWMKRIGMLVLAVAAAVLLSGQAKGKAWQHLEVSSLTLMDKDGMAGASLSLFGTGTPHLLLHDKNGKKRVWLGVNRDGSPALDLYDKNVNKRATLGVTTTVDKRTGAETKTAESTLTLFDAKGDVIWQAPR